MMMMMMMICINCINYMILDIEFKLCEVCEGSRIMSAQDSGVQMKLN